jgi:Esterase-like activity of phytase
VANEGNTVRVFKASLAGARDVTTVTSLATTSVTPLQKTLLFDLATCPDTGATLAPGATQPNKLLDNFEAMTLGPDLSGGRRALVIVSDDNSGTNQTARVIALAIDSKLLAAR